MTHESTFQYLKPTDRQLAKMETVRAAAKAMCDVIEANLPDGHDKESVVRSLRETLMWANVCITRHEDGSPRE